MLLSLTNLAVGFVNREGLARAVDGVSFDLKAGQSFCLVGESGCGKSVTALALLRLLAEPPARILSGRALFEGEDLLALPPDRLNQVRGARIGMIFQEPMTSLNPVLRVGEQVAEPLRLHRQTSSREAADEAVRLLEQVGLSKTRARAYPHELSGGMRQRVMIAMAMACSPALIIADEPTTALDASLQGQILDLILRLVREQQSALLLITHDLGLVSRYAEEVAVMYAGKIVESGPVRQILEEPDHPYTRGLIASRPQPRTGQRQARLPVITGSVPLPLRRPPGCAFNPRCPLAAPRCLEETPPAQNAPPGRSVLCWQVGQAH
ncbi:MAG: ABC transporter ATP-binding protein [Desulfovibrionaceae bacterium]|nr:ABC transporter ATP-binding protein [Desulfovibrionaceae bacterium]